MATPGIAAGAYAHIARLADAAAGARGLSGEAAKGQDFGALVKDALAAVAQSGNKSEAQTQALAAGKANIVDVVTAVSETEVAIEALVAVRDKVIQAYEEILRMPI